MSKTIRSAGESKTRCRAIVSSTTPEIRAQVPAGAGDGLDQHVADLRRQLGSSSGLRALRSRGFRIFSSSVTWHSCSSAAGLPPTESAHFAVLSRRAELFDCTSRAAPDAHGTRSIPDSDVTITSIPRRRYLVSPARLPRRAAPARARSGPGQPAADQLQDDDTQQHPDRDVPPAGGGVQEAQQQRPQAGQQVADALREGRQRGRGDRVRRPGHGVEDGQAQRGPLAQAEQEHERGGRAQRARTRPRPARRRSRSIETSASSR